jgi:type IV pilus assembly protein PilY1
MRSWIKTATSTFVLTLMTGVLVSGDAGAIVSNADYTATPPFVSNMTTPNIIILMDNSGSMSNRACESTSCGMLANGSTSTSTVFANDTRYSGYFDPLRCYVYDTGDVRFEDGTAKATLATACPSTEWDGNFLNWATLRRFDAVKLAMIGGDCAVARAADGTCPANGTPALKTVRAQANGVGTERADVNYNGGAGANTYVGRIPSGDRTGNPGTISIGVGDAYFCVDNDTSFNSNCGDSYSVRKYELKIGYATEPTGVIQQIGNKARFGLFEFKSSSEGARMLVGAGSRQSIDWSGSGVETFNTNAAAMIDAVQESFPSTWTPLGESLYESARYVAQINSNLSSSAYVYPIAFAGGVSNGVNYQTNGVGSIGTSEITALGSGESCPAGYIANACGRDPYFFGKNHTPAWASTSQVVNCCRTFVILFTDGEPTEDQNIPAALQDYAHTYHGVHCTGTDTAAPPRPINGTCNANAATPFSELLAEHKTDYADNGSHYLDEVAYWAHTNDLRPCSGTGNGTIAVLNVTGHCLPGTQNVTVYSFFAFGNINGRGILAQTARLGGFEDLNGDGIPQTGEWDKENNYTGAATPDGIPDAYFESSNVDDLQDKMLATIASILRRSSSGSSVSVLATASTGEGALYQSYFYPSTLETSTLNDVKWIGYTQSLFVDTYGNLREDTDGNAKLSYKEDKIVKTRFDGTLVRVDKFDDSSPVDGLPDDKNGDGIVRYPDDCNPCNGLLSDMLPIWEAGKQLALKDAGTRTILTWVDSDHDGIVDAGEQIPFTTANSSTLYPYLRAADTTAADKIINFVRGCERTVCTEQTTTRDRRLQVPPASGNLKVWKLGDAIHSTPTVVAAPRDRYDVKFGDTSYGDFLIKYHNRRQVAYVGGNDGMLHAFNAGYYHTGDDPSTGTASSSIIEHGYFTRTPTDNSSGPQLGEELWGFIPYELLPQLEFLTRSDYQHVYYVDLPLTVADVRIFDPADPNHPGGWGTILIGGFRLGGSCGACTAGTGGPPMTVNVGGTNYNFYSAYFALDVTNPEVQPKLLWSFSDATLGLSTSVPAIVRVNPTADAKVSHANAKWYMVVGSGMTDYAGASSQNAKVFVVNLQSGPGTNNALVASLPVGSWDSFLGDMVAFDKNLDFRHDAIYFGRVIDDGTPPWRGKIYRLTTAQSAPFGGATSPSAWGIASGSNRVPTEMLDMFPSGASPAKEMGPVATAPGLGIDDGANVWVFAGSGRYYSTSDKTDQSTQHFVGLKDSVLNANCNQTVGITSCMEDNLVDMSNTKVCIVGVGDCGASGGTNQVTGGPSGVATFSELVSHIQNKDGWFVSLLQPANPPGQPTAYGIGERVVNPPTVFGGIVFFPTFTPTSDVCASSGTSKLFALFYKTGSAYQEPIIGTSSSGTNQNVNSSMSIGDVLAFGGVVLMGDGYQMLNNTDQGSLACPDPCNQYGGGAGIDVNVAIDPRSRYFSWLNM